MPFIISSSIGITCMSKAEIYFHIYFISMFFGKANHFFIVNLGILILQNLCCFKFKVIPGIANSVNRNDIPPPKSKVCFFHKIKINSATNMGDLAPDE